MGPDYLRRYPLTGSYWMAGRSVRAERPWASSHPEGSRWGGVRARPAHLLTAKPRPSPRPCCAPAVGAGAGSGRAVAAAALREGGDERGACSLQPGGGGRKRNGRGAAALLRGGWRDAAPLRALPLLAPHASGVAAPRPSASARRRPLSWRVRTRLAALPRR